MTTSSTPSAGMSHITDCPFCKEWMNYGSDEDNALMEKISPPSKYWNGKECHRLLKMLYLKEISIEEFKEQFTAAGMDYNMVEHCGSCAGCYESESHICPNFFHEGGDCKINDLVIYCNLCGPEGLPHGGRGEEGGLYGFFTSDKDKDGCKEPFWLCAKHEIAYREITERLGQDINSKELAQMEEKEFQRKMRDEWR